MQKRYVLLMITLLIVPIACQSAGVAVYAMWSKFKEEMKVGQEQKVKAKTVRILEGDDIIEVFEKKAGGTWVIKALKPGRSRVALEKAKSGHKVKRHMCDHWITVIPDTARTPGKKRTKSEKTDKKASKNPNKKTHSFAFKAKRAIDGIEDNIETKVKNSKIWKEVEKIEDDIESRVGLRRAKRAKRAS